MRKSRLLLFEPVLRETGGMHLAEINRTRPSLSSILRSFVTSMLADY